jgi:hypothetical protein
MFGSCGALKLFPTRGKRAIEERKNGQNADRTFATRWRQRFLDSFSQEKTMHGVKPERCTTDRFAIFLFNF